MDTLMPPNGKQEIIFFKCGQVPELKAMVRNGLNSSCIELLFAGHWVLNHRADGIDNAQGKPYHRQWQHDCLKQCGKWLFLLTCLLIGCEYSPRMHSVKVCTMLGS